MYDAKKTQREKQEVKNNNPKNQTRKDPHKSTTTGQTSTNQRIQHNL